LETISLIHQSSPILVFFFAKKCTILADFQHVNSSADGRQTSTLTILRIQVLYLVLVIAGPQHSCCSACHALHRRKHFVHCQKATQIMLSPKLTNKIKPPILGVDNRLVE